MTTLAAGGTDGTVVASRGKWWAVWAENGNLYQRRTMYTPQPRTQITSDFRHDSAPRIGLRNGVATLVWLRSGPMVYYENRVAESINGGSWTSRTLEVGAGVADVTAPDLRVASNAGGIAWSRYDGEQTTKSVQEIGSDERRDTSAWLGGDDDGSAAANMKVFGGRNHTIFWNDIAERVIRMGEFFDADGPGYGWHISTLPVTGKLQGVAEVGSRMGVLYSTGNQLRLIIRTS
ncbi:hypothetical protein [Nakamurella aerolata]|uniref:Uncharacterized protein n=1 Tax=Nakamurella aerolata TaxID=1656892 RepID=A0A849AIS2_9ACTN|nr:hypothetical protein [Nakamurella aerolata]NNG36702.1 hypothetical protein [Nakamurella aerolata]